MSDALIDQAIELLEKANADLEPELLPAPLARTLLASYARARRLVDFGIADLSRKVDDASEVAKVTGTSMGHAKAVVATGKVLGGSKELSSALQHGDVSLDQAREIAAAEESAPGAAHELVAVAQEQPFHVLKDKARKTKLEAEQHKNLAARQRAARFGRSHSDELGMLHIHLALEPHVGTPIVARAEAEASRLANKAKAAAGEGPKEAFERHLADAYASLLAGSGTGRAKRPELVVLVNHEVVTRGWSDVREGEVCKIPGVGPVAPQVAKEIAENAFLSGVFFDGKGPQALQALDQEHPDRRPDRPRARGAAGLRRGLVRGVRQQVQNRVRSRHASLQTRPDLATQPQASLLEVPSGKERARSQGGQVQAPRTVTMDLSDYSCTR